MRVRCIDCTMSGKDNINGIEYGCVYDVEEKYNVQYLGKTIEIFVINGIPFRSERFIIITE